MKTAQALQFTGIIPARYASSRLPGKPLCRIGEKSMIQMVYEKALERLENVYVATDDERIFSAVRAFGGKAIMTSPFHLSGTDRCAEAVKKIMSSDIPDIDIIINIQGDEPFIRIEQIDLLINCFSDPDVEIATLINKAESHDEIFNPNLPKVIVDKFMNAIYFSRSAIPYVRDTATDTWHLKHTFYTHQGIYAYKWDTLGMITTLRRSPLEVAESLEQNRWLENGFKIRTAVSEHKSISVDTPEDLEKARNLYHEIK
jgi:3-deoxy-manno-octulosonate cytidylyltransferase (CMP-KDO synthetase)